MSGEMRNLEQTFRKFGETVAMLGPLKLIESPLMVKRVEKIVPRTWKERLFERPWRPWQKIRIQIEIVPMKEVYMIDGKRIIGHPATIRKIRDELQATREVATDSR
jgi:hypothetical protein